MQLKEMGEIMNLLWIINHSLPKVSEAIGKPVSLSQGWLVDLANNFAETEGINLAVVSICSGEKYYSGKADNMKYYVLPMAKRYHNSSFYDKYWAGILEDFKPDIVNIFGTENLHGFSFVNRYPNVKTVLTIQGIMTRIAEEYYGGLSLKDVLINRTLKENLTFGGMLGTKNHYKRLKKLEQEIVKKVPHIVYRTLWDYAVLKNINPKASFYKYNWNLREEFYNAKKWDVENIEKYSIYTSFANYPLKGLHILIRALKIVKEQYSTVKLYVPGLKGDVKGQLIVDSGYKMYVNKLVNELDLKENIIFVGGQSAAEVVGKMQKSNLVVVPSAIEGDSATICEAMYIGTPCICAFRGGMTELLKHRESGFYYDFSEYSYLAERIIEVFSDNALAQEFSKKLITDGEIRNDRKKNIEDAINVYKEILY